MGDIRFSQYLGFFELAGDSAIVYIDILICLSCYFNFFQHSYYNMLQGALYKSTVIVIINNNNK